MQLGGVAERKDDGPLDVLRHLLDDFLGEGARLSGRADQDVGLDLFDQALKVAVVLALPFGIVASVTDLGRSKVVLVGFQEES